MPVFGSLFATFSVDLHTSSTRSAGNNEKDWTTHVHAIRPPATCHADLLHPNVVVARHPVSRYKLIILLLGNVQYPLFIQQSGWFERSWLGWAANNSLTDLHPVVPEAYKRVAVQPLLRLTPALRALHLDAKKGRGSPTSAAAFSSSTAEDESEFSRVTPREASTTTAPTNNRTESETAEEVLRDDSCLDGGVVSFDERTTTNDPLSGQHSRREHFYAKCARSKGRGGKAQRLAGRRRSFSEGAEGGCERKLATQWTNWQRILCLIPDVEGGMDFGGNQIT